MKARFTGHDTFPLRYGWLYKAVDFISNGGKLLTSNEENTRDAIVKLGVGKNMINAIKYWGESTSVVVTESKNNSATQAISHNGMYLFGTSHSVGKDPYLENIGSIWLIHFWLNFNADQLTAYRYFFNFSNFQHFEKVGLLDALLEDASSLTTDSTSNEKTIKKDLDCFFNTYCKKRKSKVAKVGEKITEEHFSSPLVELNLVQDVGGGFYKSDLSVRDSLPIEVFIYALIEYVKFETLESQANSLDFDSIQTKPYSPGRIFRLSESGLGQLLDEAQKVSNSDITWIDSLGLRQIQIDRKLLDDPIRYLDAYFHGVKNNV